MDLFGYTPIRALNWKQPYGTAMLFEKIETREWATKYRGLVLICTSKAAYTNEELMTLAGENITPSLMSTVALSPDTKELKGFAIAVGELYHCRRMRPEDEAKAFVKFNPLLYCHFYRNVRRIKPLPWVGTQGWAKLTPDFISQIEYLEAA